MIGPSINFADIQDPVLRRNFQNLVAYINQSLSILSGFQFFELVFKEAVFNQKIAHTIGKIPSDVIVTQCTGEGSVTFNFGRFDENYLDVSTSGPCRVRMFIGNQPTQARVNAASSDSQTINPGG